jgi:hypothetical protein
MNPLDDRARDLLRTMLPPELLRLLQRVQLATTADGRPRVDRAFGVLAAEAMPIYEADQVTAPEGSGYDSVADALSGASGTYAPIDTPTFVGTVTAPALVVETALTTAALTTAALTATGDSALGNGAADVATVWGHLRHRGAAPSIAAGAALGTGGSVGATISGTDQAMSLTLTAGSTGLGTGTAATITYAAARTSNARSLSPINAAARANAVQAGLSGSAGATATIVFGVAPTAGTVYQYDLVVVEWSP